MTRKEFMDKFFDLCKNAQEEIPPNVIAEILRDYADRLDQNENLLLLKSQQKTWLPKAKFNHLVDVYYLLQFLLKSSYSCLNAVILLNCYVLIFLCLKDVAAPKSPYNQSIVKIRKGLALNSLTNGELGKLAEQISTATNLPNSKENNIEWIAKAVVFKTRRIKKCAGINNAYR